MRMYRRFQLVDDETDGVKLLFWQRFPWLIVGALGGIAMTLLVASYERVITGEIRLAFFLPIIVYLSDAAGTQTEAIVVRSLAKHRPHIVRFLAKESLLGLTLGTIFGLLLGLFALYWYHDVPLAVTVGLAMFINIMIATVMALIIPMIIYKENRDPALGSGPITTAIQDFISISVYFAVASTVLLTLR